MINRFQDMDTYFTEINQVLLASRSYEYDGFLFSKYRISSNKRPGGVDIFQKGGIN
jgi:hypothetical protein